MFNQRTQLVERVERQKLDPAALINGAFTELFLCALHHARGTAVTVGNRQPDALALFIDQDIVHTPGINTDTVNADTFIADFFQPQADGVFETVEIPGVETVLLLQTVDEAMDFTQRQGAMFTVIARQHYASAGGAKIDSDTMAKSHSEVLLSFIRPSLENLVMAHLLVTDRQNWPLARKQR